MLITDIFGDYNISNAEYLYSLDESDEFVYVEFAEGGYCIFLHNNGDILEYSLSGDGHIMIVD